MSKARVAWIVCFFGSMVFSQIWVENARSKTGKQNPNFYEIQAEFEAYWKDKDHTRKGVGWKPFKRWEEYASYRLDENGNFNARGLWEAWQEYQVLVKEKQEQLKTLEANWTVLGPETSVPSPGGTGYRVNGGAGRINCIAFHPSNTQIIYVGAPSGGLWKSSNGGQSWTCLTNDLPNMGVSSIVVDHSNPNVIYIATGDAHGAGPTGGTYSVGILKSTNGGSSWSTTGLGATEGQQLTIYELVMHPQNNQMLVAGTNAGLYRSLDAGASWQALFTSGVFTDVHVDTVYPQYWYATAMANGIVVSNDTTDSWTWGAGLPEYGNPFGRVELTISKSNPDILYAVYAVQQNSDYNGGLFAIFKSTDGGYNWGASYVPDLNGGVPNLLGWYDGLSATGNPDVGGQGWYDLDIIVDPSNENVVYVGGVNIWKSTDGGFTWSPASFWLEDNDYFTQGYTHADQHAFVFAPGTNTLFVGNDGGIFRQSGSEWSDLSDGLGIHMIYCTDTAQTRNDMHIVGAQDNGCSRYMSGAWKAVVGGDGMEVMIDYTDANIVYASNYNGVHHRSDDGGTTFSPIMQQADGAWVTPLEMDPVTPSTLYRAAVVVSKSTDRGNTWTAISPQISGYALGSMAIAPSDPRTIYVADQHYNQNSQVLARTTDGGANWSAVTSPTGVTDMAVHPTQPNTIYATRYGFTAGEKVYKSENGGQSWTNISSGLPNLPVSTVVIDPGHPSHVYVGTDLGVFISMDGAAWLPYNENLPNVIIKDLVIHKSSRTLRAATYGRGLWESPLEASSGAVSDNNTRWVPHVTRIGGLFTTDLVLTNNASETASITLQPYTSSGSQLPSKTFSVPGWGFSQFSAASAFPADVSHFSISGPNTVVVTAGYRIGSGQGATAHVNETSASGTNFYMFPGEWDTIFDGMALVNLSTSPSEVNVAQYGASGKTLAQKRLSAAPFSKTLQVFGDSFPNVPGSMIHVNTSQPASVLFLRGTYPGTSPAYLYQTTPLLTRATGSSRWISHVTPPTAAFTSTLYFTNLGGSDANLTLQPYASNGSALSSKTIQLPSMTYMRNSSTNIFPGETVSHFKISGPDTCTVAIGYKIATGRGATAHVNETHLPSGNDAQYFILYQGEWNTIFDGMAIVNLGNASADITGFQYDAAGNQVSSVPLKTGLAPHAKHLLVFDSVFQNREDWQIFIGATQPCVVLFLRGTPPGVSPGYLYQTEPVPLSVP